MNELTPELQKHLEKLVDEHVKELLGQAEQEKAVWNMGDVHKFGKMRFSIGPEDPDKRKHVHVRVPGVGSVRFWLTRRIGDKDIRDIELDEKTRVGNVDLFEQAALEQIQVYYDDIIANINRHYKGDPTDPVKPTIGQKTKGQNSPKAVAARKAAEKAARTSS